MHHCRTRAGIAGRPWHTAGGPALALLTLLCAAVTLTPAAAASQPPPGLSSQAGASRQLAVLDYEHRAYRFSRTTSELKLSIPAHRPITGESTTLPVLAQTTSHDGQRWLKVMLPGRPNSSTGWIKRAGTRQLATSWYILINTARRQVWIYHHGQLARTFSAVVGKPSTPTPTGRFFVEETVILPPSEPGGPYALALSARSNVLQEFDGGPGQIAIHGRDGLGGTPGQAQSHGCVRLTTPDIDWLSARIAPGTPVTIT